MRSPQRWANDITIILKTVFGEERFPIDIQTVAREFSLLKCPDDPVTMIQGAHLPGFEGALVPAPAGKIGWGILYNSSIVSRGRINFTLAHEFGHYLLHRTEYPNGFQCSSEEMANWDSEFGQLEHQANIFAATLLMPLDDFRQQIDEYKRPTLEDLGYCAKRYAVSLTASVLRWLQYTTRSSVLVVSREGYVLWARSSRPALKSGLFYRTRNRPPVEIPTSSLAAKYCHIGGQTGEAVHDDEVWLGTSCTEQILFSSQHDFAISLLHFGDIAASTEMEEAAEEDTFDRMAKRTLGQSWFD